MVIEDHKHHIFLPEIHQEHNLKQARHMIHKSLSLQAYFQFIKSYALFLIVRKTKYTLLKNKLYNKAILYHFYKLSLISLMAVPILTKYHDRLDKASLLQVLASPSKTKGHHNFES